jgi:hypothetical protein
MEKQREKAAKRLERKHGHLGDTPAADESEPGELTPPAGENPGESTGENPGPAE